VVQAVARTERRARAYGLGSLSDRAQIYMLVRALKLAMPMTSPVDRRSEQGSRTTASDDRSLIAAGTNERVRACYCRSSAPAATPSPRRTVARVDDLSFALQS